MQPEYRYEIVIYWSNADHAFIAEVPELPGCAADGPTYREAIENAETVIREWIETAAELGRAIPRTPRSTALRVGGAIATWSSNTIENDYMAGLTRTPVQVQQRSMR